jgi:hypothetical protein
VATSSLESVDATSLASVVIGFISDHLLVNVTNCREVSEACDEVPAVDRLDRQPDMIGEKLGDTLRCHHYGSGRTVLPFARA